MNAHPKIRGFTLLELIIGIGILAILASVALPTFKSMLLNARVRNAAQSILAGIQKAQNEAPNRGAQVQFILTNNTDASWTVQQLPIIAGDPIITIESSVGSNEGSKKVSVGIVGGNSITFTPLRQVVQNGGITRIDLSVTDGKPLSITIDPISGSPKMCDPHLVANSNPRACPY